jgi:type II secretion system protein G
MRYRHEKSAKPVFVIAVTLGCLVVAISATASRRVKAAADVSGIVEALGLYSADVGTYPTDQQGLQILTIPTTKAPQGYLDKIPIDAWGRPYYYRIPGAHNPNSFDVWTYGADGVPGGCGQDRDVGNWEPDEGAAACPSYVARAMTVAAVLVVSGLLCGAAVLWRRRGRVEPKA